MPSIPVGELLGWDIVIVLVVILVLFGGSQLPKLARSLGEAKKEFETGVTKSGKTDDNA
jgi:sec-independent protein translocase protein TatA